MSSAALINQYVGRNEIDKVDKHVQRIKSSVNHLTSILNDFLSLGKLEEGKIDVNKEPIPVIEFLHEVKEEMTASLKPGQTLIIDCDVSVVRMNSDSRILRNILFNLISNASKYSAADKSIKLECFADKNNIGFAIRDEGIGIPVEDQRHMFDRFFRASNAGNVQGTGLGLNIVRRYVELLEGTISFSSEYGKGSVFTVIIPIQ
jgi:signal transduction histidine kinase